MNHEEVGRVLAAAAGRDNRTVGAADVLAWHEDIGDLDYADALAAVSRHYRQSTDRLMPAHVRRLAAEIRRDRERAERERHLAVVSASLAELAPAPPTRDRKADVQALIADLRDRLPRGDPAKLRGPAWQQRTRAGLRAAPLPPVEPSTPVTSEPVAEHEDPTPKEPQPDAAPAA